MDLAPAIALDAPRSLLPAPKRRSAPRRTLALLGALLLCAALAAAVWLRTSQPRRSATPAVHVALAKHPRSSEFRRVRTGGRLGAVHAGTSHNAMHNVPMGGNMCPMAIYYTTICAGTPAVEFNVSLDTGSTDLLLPGAGCAHCGTGALALGRYDPAKSTTAAPVPCRKELNSGKTALRFATDAYPRCSTCVSDGDAQLCGFENTYMTCNMKNESDSCTISGPLYEDVVEIAGLSAPTALGMITEQTANFDQMKVVSGIMGLAYPDQGFGPSALAAVVERNPSELANLFTMCFNDVGGVLSLGAIDSSLLADENAPIVYAPIVDKAWYTIELDAVYVGEKRVDVSKEALNAGSCISDSGTNTGVMMNAPVWRAMKELLLAHCDDPHSQLHGICDVEADGAKSLFDGECMEFSPKQIAAFPQVTVSLGEDKTMTVHPENYLMRKVVDGQASELRCLGLGGGDESDSCIIGDALMKEYLTVYDVGRNRLGWAPVNATRCKELAAER